MFLFLFFDYQLLNCLTKVESAPHELAVRFFGGNLIGVCVWYLCAWVLFSNSCIACKKNLGRVVFKISLTDGYREFSFCF